MGPIQWNWVQLQGMQLRCRQWVQCPLHLQPKHKGTMSHIGQQSTKEQLSFWRETRQERNSGTNIIKNIFFDHGAAYGEYQVISLNMDRKRERIGLSRTDLISFAFWPEASEVLMLDLRRYWISASLKQYK